MTCFTGSADLAWTCLILARLAMKGGQVQEPKLMIRGSPALARLSRGTCNSPPDWLTFFGSFFWSNGNLLGAADAISLLASFIFSSNGSKHRLVLRCSFSMHLCIIKSILNKYIAGHHLRYLHRENFTYKIQNIKNKNLYTWSPSGVNTRGLGAGSSSTACCLARQP